MGCTPEPWGKGQIPLRGCSLIFDQSWWLVQVPENWRKANVRPVFKKDRQKDRGNYWLVSIRTWRSWRNLLTGTSWSSARRSAKSCTCGGATPGTRTCWGPPSLAERGSGDPGGHQVEHEPAVVPWLQRRLTVLWAVLSKVLPASWGRWSFPSAQHW